MEKIPLPLRLRQLKILPQPFLISEKNGMACIVRVLKFMLLMRTRLM